MGTPVDTGIQDSALLYNEFVVFSTEQVINKILHEKKKFCLKQIRTRYLVKIVSWEKFFEFS